MNYFCEKVLRSLTKVLKRVILLLIVYLNKGKGGSCALPRTKEGEK